MYFVNNKFSIFIISFSVMRKYLAQSRKKHRKAGKTRKKQKKQKKAEKSRKKQKKAEKFLIFN